MLPWNDEVCPAWDNEFKICTIKNKVEGCPCSRGKDGKIECWLANDERTDCAFEQKFYKEVKPKFEPSIENCSKKYSDWRQCPIMYKFAWDKHRTINGTMKQSFRYYNDMYGKEIGDKFKKCPYIYIEDSLFGDTKFYCLAEGEKKEIAFADFVWYCSSAVIVPNTDKSQTIYNKHSSAYSFSCNLFPECPKFQKGIPAVVELLPTKEEIEQGIEEARIKKEKLYNTIKEWEGKAEEIAGDIIKNHEKVTNNNSGCFITTATLITVGGCDDGYELTMFRRFRDTYLINQPNGNKLVKLYYNIAPTIVEKIDAHNDKCKIYNHIWNSYLSKCLICIQNQDYKKCADIYIDMVKQLSKHFLNKEIIID